MAWAIGASQPDDWAIGASQPTAAAPPVGISIFRRRIEGFVLLGAILFIWTISMFLLLVKFILRVH